MQWPRGRTGVAGSLLNREMHGRSPDAAEKQGILGVSEVCIPRLRLHAG